VQVTDTHAQIELARLAAAPSQSRGWFARKESLTHDCPPDPRRARRLPAGS